jgi:hypothetical protein
MKKSLKKVLEEQAKRAEKRKIQKLQKKILYENKQWYTIRAILGNQ